MKGLGQIPTVDPHDLRTILNVQRECPSGSIDALIYSRLCKPGADVVAGHLRASLMGILLQSIPELAEFVQDGEPSDALVLAFALVPMEHGKALHAHKLMKYLPKGHPR